MAETTIREVVLKGVNASSKIASTFFLDKELLSVYYLHWKSVRPCIPARQHPCWRFFFSYCAGDYQPVLRSVPYQPLWNQHLQKCVKTNDFNFL